MAKSVHDDVLDGALSVIKTNATIITVCSAQPTTRNEALVTYALADVAVDTNDFTIANGDTNGRKLTIAAQNGVPVDASNTATHIAIVDGSRLLYVTTCTSQALTSGNQVNLPAWDIEIADPV